MPRWVSCVLASLVVFSSSCFAVNSVTQFVSPHMSATLPQGMTATWKDEDDKLKLFRYQFQSGNAYDHTLQEMRVVVGDIVPKNKAKLEAWQNDTLGSMIAIFADAHHVSLESNSEQLNQKPTNVMIGHQRFKQMNLQFGSLHAQLLLTISNNMAYMFTLATDQTDEAARAHAFRSMHTAIKAASYR